MDLLINLHGALPEWVVDAETLHIVKANPAAVILWGYDEADLFQLHMQDRLTADHYERVMAAFEEMRLGISGPWICQRKDGVQFKVTSSWTRVEVRGRSYIHVVILSHELMS